MSQDDLWILEESLRVVLAAVRGSLPGPTVSDVLEFIQVGEIGLAFETLCTQLIEWEVVVDPIVVDRLRSVGQSLGSDPKLWEML